MPRVAPALLLFAGGCGGVPASPPASVPPDGLSLAPWIREYEGALAEAKASGKPILAYFALSEGGAEEVQRAFETGTLSDPRFLSWAREQVILFCQRLPKGRTGALWKEKGGRMLPYFVFLDPDGEVAARHVGPLGPEDLARTGEAARAMMVLKGRGAAGDLEADRRRLLAQLEMKVLDPAEARRRAGILAPFPPQDAARMEALLLANEVDGILRTSGSNREAGERFLAMKQGGRIPSERGEVRIFWVRLLELADAREDAALYEEAFLAMKALFSDAGYGKFFAPREKRLQELKAGRPAVDSRPGGGDTSPR